MRHRSIVRSSSILPSSTLSAGCVITASAACALAALTLASCDAKSPPSKPSTPTASNGAGATAGAGKDGGKAGHDHDHDHDHDHAKGHDHDHDHGAGAIDLGSSTIGAFSVTASRDKGAIEAGKEAAIDVVVKPSAGATAKVSSVRFWIGTEDGKGSVKAKAEIEDPKDPTRWHTHAEVPKPLPAGSMLWIEIEAEGGKSAKGSFPLKR